MAIFITSILIVKIDFGFRPTVLMVWYLLITESKQTCSPSTGNANQSDSLPPSKSSRRNGFCSARSCKSCISTTLRKTQLPILPWVIFPNPQEMVKSLASKAVQTVAFTSLPSEMVSLFSTTTSSYNAITSIKMDYGLLTFTPSFRTTTTHYGFWVKTDCIIKSKGNRASTT